MPLALVIKKFNEDKETALAIDAVSQFCIKKPKAGGIIFFREATAITQPLIFGVMHDVHMWNFYGPTIATDFKSAQRLIKTPGPIKKYYYIRSLDWMNRSFKENNQVYMNIELIAKNQEDYDIIKKCWKKPQYIMDDYDISILETIYKESLFNEQRLPHYV